MIAIDTLASQAHSVFAIDIQAACEERKVSMTSSPGNPTKTPLCLYLSADTKEFGQLWRPSSALAKLRTGR